MLFALIVFLYALIVKGFSAEESFIIGYQLFFILRFINNIGYTICFFDFLCFYSALDTLLMPMIGYRIFNINNSLARVWGWYMRVPQETYYGFLIPANVALALGLNLLIKKYKPEFFKQLLERLIEDARDKGKIGIVLTIIGFLSAFLTGTNSVLAFVFHLLSMLKYVGPFYIYFSNLRFRKVVFFLSLLIFLGQAIYIGLFGEFVMYLVLALMIVVIQYNIRFNLKLVVFSIGLFLIIVLQSVKGTYRFITWQGKEKMGLSTQNSSKIGIFGALFFDRMSNLDNLLDERSAFGIYTRMNQGYLISRAMNYVPRVEPYADGETIAKSVAAILVPRILWPDKPEAGGRENLSRFLGIKTKLTYSMNIGPYGEAYGNFGPQYGVLFVFLYGLFTSLLFRQLLEKSKLRPTLIIWAPLLFYSTLTVETDILSTLNAFIKGAIFVALLFWISKKFFKTSL